MKKDTVTKLKFKRLQRQLQLPLWKAIGLLEAVWHCAMMNAPDGDIGKLADEDIAAAIEWDGDASQLITALVDCEWLDRDDEFRLIVHNWSDHVPNYMKGAYEKHGKLFADQAAKERAMHAARQGAKQDALAESLAPAPILSYSSPSKPSPSSVVGGRQINGTFPLAFDMWWTTYPQHKRTKRQATFEAWHATAEALMRRAMTREQAEDWLLTRLRLFTRSPASKGRYCPGSESWLRDGRYDDGEGAWSEGSSDQPKKQRIPGPEDAGRYNPVSGLGTE